MSEVEYTLEAVAEAINEEERTLYAEVLTELDLVVVRSGRELFDLAKVKEDKVIVYGGEPSRLGMELPFLKEMGYNVERRKAD